MKHNHCTEENINLEDGGLRIAYQPPVLSLNYPEIWSRKVESMLLEAGKSNGVFPSHSSEGFGNHDELKFH